MRSVAAVRTLTGRRRAQAPPAASAPGADPDLIAQRERLSERFAIMQSELGGAFYEMAIRDHVRLDVLMRKAAELQRVDTELGAVERLLETGETAGGACGACGAVYARGAMFCAQCANPLRGS
jgi:hypothetical protein